MEIDPVVQYALDRGIKIGIEAFEKWKDTFLNDPRVIIAKSDAEKLAGGRWYLKTWRIGDLFHLTNLELKRCLMNMAM